jgi:hypothetical protein
MFHNLHRHWAEIAVIYLLIVKVLTAIQDALDATPKDAPFLRKVIAVMTGAGQILFTGNRVIPIQKQEDKK